MKKRIVEARPVNPSLVDNPPKPASLFIPDWYKKTPKVKDKILTAKRCIPILDAMSAGYMFCLPTDVHWDSEADLEVKKPYSANYGAKVVTEHHLVQTDSFDISDEYDPQPYKWSNEFHIKLPKGYSMLFVHPLNRTDLPFYSFTGFVDADKHPLVINFPFVIKKGFSGVIPAGTPIIQGIPIKREDWELKIKDKDKAYRYVKEYEIMNPPFASYKRKWWTKKIYQ
jgi:hypothetical protein